MQFNLPTGLSPAISSFTASPVSIMGQSATLNWAVSGADYNLISLKWSRA
jgi:hypothetical protein